MICKMSYVVEVPIWRVSHINEINLYPLHKILCNNGVQGWLGFLRLLKLAGRTVFAKFLDVLVCYSTVVAKNLTEKKISYYLFVPDYY